jgi:hypothetical protein
MKCGHLIQLLTLVCLCVVLLFLAPTIMKPLILFPLVSFSYFFLLELLFLFTNDEP